MIQTLRQAGQRRAAHGAVWVLLLSIVGTLDATPIVFQLRDGDRVTGTVVSEGTNAVVIATAWGGELIIPLEQIQSRELLVSAAATNTTVAAPVAGAGATNTTTVATAVVSRGKSTTAIPPQPAQPKLWRADAKLGLDWIRGEKERQTYYGQFALTYTKAQPEQPDRFFRNKLEYRADYAETDGVESANRMYGSNKTDWDVGSDLFVYNLMGLGYDTVRRIDLQYEIGPGLGYHLVRQTNFLANVESGLTYQMQERAKSREVDAAYLRVGQDFSWKLLPRLTFSQRGALLTRVDDTRQMQLRMEGNLALGINKNLSLNLTAIELYETRPAMGVTGNEFQLRSAIGVTF